MIERVVVCSLIACSINIGTVLAQPSLLKMSQQAVVQTEGPDFTVKVSSQNSDLGSVRFSKSRPLAEVRALPWLASSLEMRSGIDEWRPVGRLRTKDSLLIQRYEQYFRGIRVTYGTLSTLTAGGNVCGMSLEFFPVKEDLRIAPLITESAALERARQFLGARKYAWDDYTGSDSLYKQPAARLEIVRPWRDSSRMELCFVFEIYSLDPHQYNRIMVSALNGEIIRSENLDPNNCFRTSAAGMSENPDSDTDTGVLSSGSSAQPVPLAQVPGSGNTRYSGFHTDVLTDNASGNPQRPFRLIASPGINNPVVTLDYQQRPDNNALSDGLAVDYLDDDNNWNEYADQGPYDANNTLSAFEVHFNMQLISEYWMQRHERRSWNGTGGEMRSYVNAMLMDAGGQEYENAGWSPRKRCMYFSRTSLGPGNPYGIKPLVALDICAHEIGHAVCSSLVPSGPGSPDGGLASIGESGALDEGFSDIWAACIKQYANEKFPPPLMDSKDLWQMGKEVMTSHVYRQKARNLASPKASYCPDTYRSGIFWMNADDITPGNDFGGIHTNCTVLGKWFQLLTAGGSGTNDLGVSYAIEANRAFGFQKSERLVFALEAMLPHDADFEAAQASSVIAMEGLNAQSPLDYTEEDFRTLNQAWTAVGVLSAALYDMQNQSAFLTNEFKCVAVGKDGVVWAGTNQKGLYRYDGLSNWVRCTGEAISTYNIHDMDADANGVLWIAQSGREFEGDNMPFNGGGGAHRFPDPACSPSNYYTPAASLTGNSGIVSRNSRQLFINNTPAAPTGPQPHVWITGLSHHEPDGDGSVFRRGGISLGTWNQAAYVFKHSDGEITSENNGAVAIGGDATRVWVSVRNNGSVISRSQLLVYTNTGTDISYLGALDNSNTPQLAIDFDARAIYFDRFGYRWVGMSDGQIVLRNGNTDEWRILQFQGIENIFPPGTAINTCITGDDQYVYIATSTGLVIYKGMGTSFQAADFKRYTTANGLPTNNIDHIAPDPGRGGIWLASSKGIYFMPIDVTPQGIRCDISADPATKLCNKQLRVKVESRGVFRNTPSPNKFIIEMSDANGSFDNPIQLKDPIVADSINATYNIDYPASMIDELDFSLRWVRVRSTNPPRMGISANYVPPPIRTVSTLDAYQNWPRVGNQIKIVANERCFTGSDWVHYFYHDAAAGNDHSSDLIVLSLGLPVASSMNTNNLTAELGICNNPAITQNKGVQVVNQLTENNPYWTMNRFWKLANSDGTTFTPPPNETPPSVRFYYSMEDLANVNGIIPNGPVDEKNLQLYTVTGPNINPDPVSNFSGCDRLNTLIYRDNVNQPLFTYVPASIGEEFKAFDFQIRKIPTGGGAGRTLSGGPVNKTNVFTVKQGNWSDPTIWSNGVVPDRDTELTLFHVVSVDVNNAVCKKLTLKAAGNFTVLSGAKINISGP